MQYRKLRTVDGQIELTAAEIAELGLEQAPDGELTDEEIEASRGEPRHV